ncbi:hypothetical protein ASPBRDRAFT_58843 [Aspergillus brasiliensis CBS 101740]|uniref:Uncharacterized protein n=1 Tax=Aspergillus brasiliensis (strain CBS 101740 / IMI 381727 / IBT 21946) TaxID=767769 RepID=A0A1L9U7W2_ASPBC|nr:hypothetical protein ASPBRDRAFT_58843 [Aspergillus brasiliensis CBS 101740]
MALMTNKEQVDMGLSIKLRKEGVITTRKLPFEQSRNEEIEGLIARGVFNFVQYDPIKHASIRIFNSRLVNEIKGKATGTPFKKSRVITYAYNNEGKGMILTQSPTMQRASQRGSIVALAPSLSEKGISLSIRDITQAHLTYHKHHRERLVMVISTDDLCWLISTAKGASSVVVMQTDDTLILGSDEFAALDEKELAEAKFSAQPKDTLPPENPLIFNSCVLTQKEGDVAPVYIEQRARGAYIATICQPEADPTKADNAFNKRIMWQMKNLDRGIKYIAPFANNKDFSSQIGYEIILANEPTQDEESEIAGNLIHWSSTKRKRVTRSGLASEIYRMVGGVDIAIAIGTTIKIITDQLGSGKIPTIVCTDPYSVYECCLVKLGPSKEKRLIIDLMALRQSYERMRDNGNKVDQRQR